MDIKRNKKNDRLCKERNDLLDRLPLGKDYETERDAWLNKDHRIYYKRKGRKVFFACTNKKCEKEFYTQNISLEESAYSYIGQIGHRIEAICPICGEKGLMVAEGRRRKRDTMRGHYAVYQMPKKNLLTIRIVQVEKEYGMATLNEVRKPGREDWETEIIRIFLYADHRVYKDYHKAGWGKDFWDYKNLAGMRNIEMPLLLQDIGKDVIKNAGWLKYIDLKKEPFVYIEKITGYMAATEYPIVEMLQKSGAYRIAHGLMGGGLGSLNRKAKKPEEFFNITKSRLKKLVRENQDWRCLKIYQQEKKCNVTMPEELVEYFAQRGYVPKPEIWKYTTAMKFWNYIKKQEKRCTDNRHLGYDVLAHYDDYLQAVIDLELPLSNDIYLYPRDLRLKHDEFVRRRNQQRSETEIKKKNETYKGISEQYTKLLKKYGYEKDDFIIRPAGSAGEIIAEGRTLHHCVGGDNYLSRHNRGESFILFLRKKESPEIPWCTIEISGTHIRQWYEAYDKKTNKEIIDPFLETYVKQLGKSKKRAAG